MHVVWLRIQLRCQPVAITSHLHNDIQSAHVFGESAQASDRIPEHRYVHCDIERFLWEIRTSRVPSRSQRTLRPTDDMLALRKGGPAFSNDNRLARQMCTVTKPYRRQMRVQRHCQNSFCSGKVGPNESSLSELRASLGAQVICHRARLFVMTRISKSSWVSWEDGRASTE